MKKLIIAVIFSVLFFGQPLISFAGPSATFFRGLLGNPENIQRMVENSVIPEVQAGKTNLLDLLIEGLEAADDVSFFLPCLRKVHAVVTWKIVHREDAGIFTPRQNRLSALFGKPARKENPKPIDFPRDGGRHLSKLIEWWYFNGHLFGDGGKEFGYELCFFRFGPVISFAHFAITDVTNNKFLYQRTIFSPFACRFSDSEMKFSYGDWKVSSHGPDFFSVKAQANGIAVNLLLKSAKKPLLVNQTGYLQMANEGYSYYYSLVRNETSGAIKFGDQSMKVTGETWVDHQWGNFFLSTIYGWEWFSLKLKNDTQYNIFCFHDAFDNLVNPLATILYPDNSQETVKKVGIMPLGYWTSPHSGRKYPSGYSVLLPEKNSSFVVKPKVVDQELPANPLSPDFIDYWEGTCNVEGKVDGKPVSGLAYNEICGYPKNR